MPATTITLRVTAPERHIARVSIRRNQFSAGRPLEFDTASPRVGAVEYVLGAIGSELVNGLRDFAARRRLDIDAIEATVTGAIVNELSYLEVVGEHGEPRISTVTVKVFVATPDDDAVRALFDDMLNRLPLFCTLRTAVRVTTELIITS